ncbi:unnamed protein product [Diamesa tonsa]
MNACRVCLGTDKDQILTSMFIDKGKNASRFSILTGLVVTEMSGLGKALICNYCSIQLELFFYWRQRCKRNDEIFRNDSNVIVPKQLNSCSIVDTTPTVDLTNNDEVSERASDLIASLQEYLTEMVSAFENSNIFQRFESLVPFEGKDTYPADSNINESDHLHQSMNCRICHQSFSSKNKCATHFKRHHPMMKQYDCRFCRRSFERAKCFHNHMLKHESGHIPLYCSQCEMRFQSKENYSLHVQTHENPIPQDNLEYDDDYVEATTIKLNINPARYNIIRKKRIEFKQTYLSCNKYGGCKEVTYDG